MTPLPQQFKGRADQKAFTFAILKRSGNVVLVEKRNPNHKSGQSFYEVAIVQERPERRLPGKVIPAHEAMPSPEQWGVAGCSPFNYEAALAKFNQLTEAH